MPLAFYNTPKITESSHSSLRVLGNPDGEPRASQLMSLEHASKSSAPQSTTLALHHPLFLIIPPHPPSAVNKRVRDKPIANVPAIARLSPIYLPASCASGFEGVAIPKLVIMRPLYIFSFRLCPALNPKTLAGCSAWTCSRSRRLYSNVVVLPTAASNPRQERYAPTSLSRLARLVCLAAMFEPCMRVRECG